MANLSTTGSSTVTFVELKRSLLPPRWADSVRVLGTSECGPAALSLAHAFATDEYTQYLLCDAAGDDDVVGDGGGHRSAEEKWRLHVDMMTYIVAADMLNGIVTSIGPDYDSVALWLPPGKDLDGWWTLLRSGMWRLYFQLPAEGRRRYNEVVPLLHDTKAAVLGERDDEAYYLVYLGTKPNARGRGYARKLLEHMIQRADAENRPVYLESSSLANNAYYSKFGFEVKRDIFLKRGQAPVRLSIMVREPQPARKVAYISAVKKFHVGGDKVA